MATPTERDRLHVERMLARARRRAKQAAKIVEKWEGRLAANARQDRSARQPRLWAEEGSDRCEGLLGMCGEATDTEVN
jgi:hypothetical protein